MTGQQELVNITGLNTLCLQCINPDSGSTDPVTTWIFSNDPPIFTGETSSDGQISNVNGVARILNPQNKILDGETPYEVECFVNTYSFDQIELYTTSKCRENISCVLLLTLCLLHRRR